MSSVLRCLKLAKQFKGVIQSPKNTTSRISIRSSHDENWGYRVGKPDPRSEQLAQFACTISWWWFLWHLWHDYDMITGEFPHIFVEKWTDEELGIPPQ
ncbi:hypothetical protein LSTR_LSTR007261 [Laodelphax striatellus]|uniref:NADH dehydrogenase [ubiquinone] 1 beta subcomplex subunit 2, mitochondrial n=1 Tax=Laodelphax striatellus TaxID=195883 RepID=A0A482XET8_LAOST|nr:hypothetical protein LSTR_LSTR007261 [Laodelphax striatellus]